MQMELLKLYSAGVPDEYLDDIKILLAKFLFAKARAKADLIWQDKLYNDEIIEKLIAEQLNIKQ
ncbi:MAG: hypothetical protein ACOYOA_08960 [Saprospiraceae bacterium]